MAILTLNKTNFDEVIANNDLVVVDFWATWCVPCKTFSEVFQTVAEQHNDVIFGSIDVDAETDLAADFNVRSIPWLLILRQNIAVFAESGAMSVSALNDLLAQAKALDMHKVRKQIEESE